MEHTFYSKLRWKIWKNRDIHLYLVVLSMIKIRESLKKVIYISFLFAGLMFASCQKEDIGPSTERTAPVWESGSCTEHDSSQRVGQDDNDEIPSTGGDTKGSTNRDIEITDPNADPDAG